MRVLTLTILFTMAFCALPLNADSGETTANFSNPADCSEISSSQNLLAMFQMPEDYDLETEACLEQCEKDYKVCSADNSQDEETCRRKRFECNDGCGDQGG